MVTRALLWLAALVFVLAASIQIGCKESDAEIVYAKLRYCKSSCEDGRAWLGEHGECWCAKGGK